MSWRTKFGISITSGPRCNFFVPSDAKTSICNDITLIMVNQSNYIVQCLQVSMIMHPWTPTKVGRQWIIMMDDNSGRRSSRTEHRMIGQIVFFQSLIVSQLFTEGMMEDPFSLFIPILFCIVAFPLLYRCISTFDTLHFDFDTSILVRKRNPYWSELGDS